MRIWCINPVKRTSLLLWRIESDKFRVIEYAKKAPLLTNVDYVLMDKKFKEIITGLAGHVETKDVTIYDKVRNLTWDNYFELRILNDITPDSINDLDDRGLNIWNYGNMAVFISGDLKNEIEKVEAKEFEFTEGFSYFAGA